MKKILIIDDEPDIRKALRSVLESMGHSVFEASDGMEGLEEFNKYQFDLIITDLIMPNKEGLETIIQLKKYSPTMKIIAISGGGRVSPKKYLDMAEKLGADKSFTKPIDYKEFIASVNEMLCDNFDK